MLEALNDPYSTYLDAETYELSSSDLEGKFEGIGAYVGFDEDERIMVIAPIVGSPADEAGIKAGDVILQVDGRSTAEMSLVEIVLHIRGQKYTSVNLLILHWGETEPEEIEIVRDEIKVPSVSFEMIDDFVHIEITYFSERTSEELSLLMDSIDQNVTKGIILDLRNNPGGLLQAVVDVAGNFLEEGVIVDVVDNQGQHTPSSVKSKGTTTNLPLVVLVNSYSASGSEVLAGALQDYGRAAIAGNITHGKGSVNELHQLQDGSALYITTARWLTPDGRPIEGVGIIPDYELDLEEEDAVQWAVDYLEGFER
jgi:carboxyl-terminal processing protease